MDRHAVSGGDKVTGGDGVTGTENVFAETTYPGDPQLYTIPPDRTSMERQPKWRRDFPIDSPQDHYVARRDFTRFLVLTSLAFVVGQFWIALQNLWRRGRGRPPVRRIARLDELPVGTAVTFHYPDATDPALLLRPDADTLLAYASQCTHLQCPVLPAIPEGKLHCPCHAGYFDLRSGRPTAGPPRRELPRITLEVRGGDIYATDIEEVTV
jgi:nitrite reductase/ring-hydroxylating ferredoxin subunit